MTDEQEVAAARQADAEPEVTVEWTLPVRMEPFLQWLDGTGLGEDDEARVAAFMELPVAKKMPGTLKDDLRKEGLL